MQEFRGLEKEIGLSERTVADIGNGFEKNNNILNSLYKHHNRFSAQKDYNKIYKVMCLKGRLSAGLFYLHIQHNSL